MNLRKLTIHVKSHLTNLLRKSKLMANPVVKHAHPGQLLKERIIEANKLKFREAAALLGISRVQLSYITTGRCGLTPEMCQRISVVFDENAETWLFMQAKYDLMKAEEEINKLNLTAYIPRSQFRTRIE